jgi:hypothetical protein
MGNCDCGEDEGRDCGEDEEQENIGITTEHTEHTETGRDNSS